MPYGNLVSQHRDAESHFYHFDGTHNTAELTDDTETVTDDYRFDAWGELLSSTGGTDNGQQYKGQFSAYRKDADAVQTERRPYQPDQARFQSEDPAEAKLNPYLYCSNNPVNYVDPSGLQEFELLPDGSVREVRIDPQTAPEALQGQVFDRGWPGRFGRVA